MRFILIAAALTLSACNQPAPEAPQGPVAPVTVDAPSGAYMLDKNHSSVVIRATHFGMSHYTLRMTGLDANLTFNAEDPTQSSVTATIAANSVATEYPGERDFNDELENSEWLDAGTHPNITFTSTSIELTGPNSGRMTGDLSIRGVTHPARFDVTFNQAYRQHPMGMPGALLGFSAVGSFKRSEYGMNVLMPAPGTNVGVSDDVEIIIEAEFTMAPPPASAVN
ncbi:yceI family protein [alpha proteobacterium U9-1i]|nr:yceI family protein [alpha proteobacterium U9-1i]